MIAIQADKTNLTIQYIICLLTPTNFELMDYCVQKCILMLTYFILHNYGYPWIWAEIFIDKSQMFIFSLIDLETRPAQFL